MGDIVMPPTLLKYFSQPRICFMWRNMPLLGCLSQRRLVAIYIIQSLAYQMCYNKKLYSNLDTHLTFCSSASSSDDVPFMMVTIWAHSAQSSFGFALSRWTRIDLAIVG